MRGSPGESVEWTLARVSGRIVDVTRIGDRWKAELEVDGERLLISGLPGSGVPSTSILEGRPATFVGIVRRPYPTATDRRYAVLPRGTWDVAIGPPVRASDLSGTEGDGGLTGAASSAAPEVTPDTDIATLGSHVGERVRVGGLIVAARSDGLLLDDGTGSVILALIGDAAPFLPLIETGEAVAASGIVRAIGGSVVVEVTEPASLVRVGALGEALPLVAPTAAPAPDAPATTQDAGLLADAPAAPATVLGVTLVSICVAFLRRHLVRRRSALVAAARLAVLRRRSPRA
jgi:hypothetical protein